MDFAEIINQQVTHKILHVKGAIGGEDQHDLSCRICYLIANQIKHEGFDRFWELVEQMGLNVRGTLRANYLHLQQISRIVL